MESYSRREYPARLRNLSQTPVRSLVLTHREFRRIHFPRLVFADGGLTPRPNSRRPIKWETPLKLAESVGIR